MIGARLNSSRLPRKQLLDLAGRPLIARVFERLEKARLVDQIILATTADGYNQPLVEWACEHGKEVFAYTGDVNDLMGRVHEVMIREKPDVLVYVCGDSPLIEPVTIDRLIDKLRAHGGDLATVASHQGRNPVHEGFTVFSSAFWMRLLEKSTEPHEREHVGAAIEKLEGNVKTVTIQDDAVYYRLDHRLSVDTPSDYRFMSEIYRRWYQKKENRHKLVDLPWVIDSLERDDVLRGINAVVKQKSAREHSARILIATVAGPNHGLGHLSRSLVAAAALQDRLAAGVTLLIAGEPIERAELSLIPHRFVSEGALHVEIEREARASSFDLLIVDWPRLFYGAPLQTCLASFGKRLSVVSIDFSVPSDHVDIQWVPSFYLDSAHKAGNVYHGWDCFLIEPTLSDVAADPRSVVVLTGGSDVLRLGKVLPSLLADTLPSGTQVHWIRGPFAPEPILPKSNGIRWQIHHAPWQLTPILHRCSFALAVYGVSLFECVLHRLPCVALDPGRPEMAEEMAAFAETGVAHFTADPKVAVEHLRHLMTDEEEAQSLVLRQGVLKGNGPAHFATTIGHLLQSRAEAQNG